MAYLNNEFSSSLSQLNQNNQNNQNISGIPKNMKITSWILFFISIIFSVLLI